MTDKERDELLGRAREFFINHIVQNHHQGLDKAGRLKTYNINPFTIRYIANFLCGDDSPESLAKALIYPRALGTSINTIFGTQSQKMIASIFEGLGSAVSGIDIEYTDSIDGRRKYCQIKAGPNTINSDDVKTILDHFKGVRNLARTNHLNVGIEDLVVGVLYGTKDELSGHYKNIAKMHPVVVGAEFWHRLTGDAGFYNDLIAMFGHAAQEIDSREALDVAIQRLADEIRESEVFRA